MNKRLVPVVSTKEGFKCILTAPLKKVLVEEYKPGAPRDWTWKLLNSSDMYICIFTSVLHEELEKKLLEQLDEKVQATEEQLRQEMLQKVHTYVIYNL